MTIKFDDFYPLLRAGVIENVKAVERKLEAEGIAYMGKDAPSPSAKGHPMTPEDRAREMLARYAGPAKDGYTQPYWRHDLADAIADALRAARNEALEEAAALAENHQNHALGLPQAVAADEIASAIRSLKQDQASDSPATTG
jgi:hypothetical protein